MIIVNDGIEISVDPMDISTWPAVWLREKKLYNPLTGGYVRFDPTDAASIINAIRVLIGPPPVPPAIDRSVSDLVPVQVAGPGATPGNAGPVLLTTYLIDPMPGNFLTAEQTEYNTLSANYNAAAANLWAQFDRLHDAQQK